MADLIDSNILNDLSCPISNELFENPVSAPCCGRAFSRESLKIWLDTTHDKRCPVCNGDLTNFDVINAPKNVNLAALVEAYKTKNYDLFTNIMHSGVCNLRTHIWSSEITPVINNDNFYLPVAELSVSLERSKFCSRPCVFIAAIDKSGSMAGNPWKQVQAALIHMISLAHQCPLLKMFIITYDSFAQILDTSGDVSKSVNMVKNLNAGGGTTFGSAFTQIENILSKFIYSDKKEHENLQNNVSNVTIAFLTDGQAQDPNVQDLPAKFKKILTESWIKKTPDKKYNDELYNPCSVHSIGFSAGCDRNFLEQLWKCGSVDGSFRYAEPGDDDDTLCQKLQSLFEIASKSSSVSLNLKLENSPFSFKVAGNLTKEIDIQFSINEIKTGVFNTWLLLDDVDKFADFKENNMSLVINSIIDKNAKVPISMNMNKKPLMDKWISVLIDEMASELVNLVSNKSNINANVFELHCSLIQQRIDRIRMSTGNQQLIEKLQYIASDVDSLKQGLAVNMGKLSDMRFGSMFGNEQSNKPKNNTPVISQTNTGVGMPVLNQKPQWKERSLRNYSRNNAGKNRNMLQETISNLHYDTMTSELEIMINNSSVSDVMNKDIDGNNALMLASFFGYSKTVVLLLDKFQNQINLNDINEDEETAVTLAIKSRGFRRTLKALLKSGAIIPNERKEGLQEFALNNGYVKTSAIIAKQSAISTDINQNMTEDYIMHKYYTICEVNKDNENSVIFDVQNYLNIAITKCMNKLVKELLSKYSDLDIMINVLLNHAIPPKPDDPETPKYLELCKMLIEYKPQLIHECNANGESPLFVASEKGSLPHVKYFISKGCLLEKENHLGNTALWIAAAKRYPCIMSELIANGADVNHVNSKGNPPLYNLCQTGPIKIVELLLANGAHVNHINKNGDTLILICCRNGQHEILRLLLNYVTPKFVDFKAHIDGFNAILASTEANRPECIKVLHEYGININQKTDDDNKILPGATSLHLAAYYNKLEAAQMLISLGTSVNELDINGQTALHIAVIQDNVNVIKLLRTANVNISIMDKSGNTAAAYCRTKMHIRKVLVDPALDILMTLAKGQFYDNTKRALEVLKNYSGAIGCMEKSQSVNIFGNDGSSVLMQAVIHSSYEVIKTLLELGADPFIENMFGVSTLVFVNWINNMRIKQLFDNIEALKVNDCLYRLKTAADLGPFDRQVLFLGNKPKETMELISSGINIRMELLQNMICSANVHDAEGKGNNGNIKDDMSPNSNLMALVEIFKQNSSKLSQAESDNLLWNAKVFTTNVIASGSTTLSPQQVLSICMFTNNPFLAGIINNRDVQNDTLKSYINCLDSALNHKSIKAFDGEVYVGVNIIDRNIFEIGKELTFNGYVSASTLWKVACDHVIDYAVKGKYQGTIFIIKSRTGKFVGPYSQFSFDGEVIFKNPRFLVTNWYRGGDNIILGQENIREHTYKLKDEEIYQMKNSQKSLVIELTEL